MPFIHFNFTFTTTAGAPSASTTASNVIPGSETMLARLFLASSCCQVPFYWPWLDSIIIALLVELEEQFDKRHSLYCTPVQLFNFKASSFTVIWPRLTIGKGELIKWKLSAKPAKKHKVINAKWVMFHVSKRIATVLDFFFWIWIFVSFIRLETTVYGDCCPSSTSHAAVWSTTTYPPIQQAPWIATDTRRRCSTAKHEAVLTEFGRELSSIWIHQQTIRTKCCPHLDLSLFDLYSNLQAKLGMTQS